MPPIREHQMTQPLISFLEMAGQTGFREVQTPSCSRNDGVSRLERKLIRLTLTWKLFNKIVGLGSLKELVRNNSFIKNKAFLLKKERTMDLKTLQSHPVFSLSVQGICKKHNPSLNSQYGKVVQLALIAAE